MKNIGSIHMDKGNAREWAETARQTGRYSSVTVHPRILSANGAQACVWVVVVSERRK